MRSFLNIIGRGVVRDALLAADRAPFTKNITPLNPSRYLGKTRHSQPYTGGLGYINPNNKGHDLAG